MSATKMSRRHLLTVAAGVGLGVVISKAEAQESTQLPRIAPDNAGRIHREMLEEISTRLGKASLSSMDGLTKILDLLVEWQVITGDERNALRDAIGAILSKRSPEEIRRQVEGLYNELRQKAGGVAVAIVSIARDSVDFVIKHQRAVSVAARDVAGALTGAATGAKLGGAPLAVICAIAGAASGSAIAAFGGPVPA